MLSELEGVSLEFSLEKMCVWGGGGRDSNERSQPALGGG